MKKIKYKGKIPARILGLGDFNPGDERMIPDDIAMELANDPNWSLVHEKKMPDSDDGAGRNKGGKK